MKNDNSKHRIAATEYFEADGKYTATIEWNGADRTYDVVEYVNRSRQVIAKTLSMINAYKMMGEHVHLAICMNHATFEQ